jgi:ketosteroid isomerase-like protein
MPHIKNMFLSILTVFICVAFVPNRANAQKKFNETLDIHLNAIRNADLVSFEPTVSDSIIHISPMGEKNKSKAQFIQLHQDWFKRTNWEWKGIVLEKHNNNSLGYALIEYSYIEKDAAGRTTFKTKCYLTLIFKNSHKGWQLVYDQNTIIPN